MNKKYYLFIFILLVGMFLRYFQLNVTPPGFFCDEAANGYIAYSVLETGRGIDGTLFPVMFRSIANDIHGGIYTYSMVPFIAIFGLNEFAVRATSAFWGILTIIALFYLLKDNCNINIALIGSFLLTISPWHIHYSRIGFRAITLPFFIIIGILFFLRGLRKDKYLLFSAISFALSFYTYAIARLFTPLIIMSIVFIYRRNISAFKKRIIIPASIFVVILLPLLYWTIFRSNELFSRVVMESMLGQEKTIINILCKFITNWLSYYSPSYLFLSGDPNIRHSINGFGQLHIFTLPFIIYGLYICIKNRRLFNTLILFWLIVYPIPASIARNAFHATRTISAIPAFQIITAIGLYALWKEKKEKVSKHILVIVSLVCFILFSLNVYKYIIGYFVKYKEYSCREWQQGIKVAMESVEEIRDKYDYVYFTRYEPELKMLALFYMKYSPKNYHTSKANELNYKYARFVDDIPMDYYTSNKKRLYVVRHFELQDKIPIKKINDLSGSIAYKIIETIGENSYNKEEYVKKIIEEMNIALREAKHIRPNIYCDLGIYYYNNGKLKKARDSFINAIEERPDYSMAYKELGITYNSMGNHEDALHSLNKSIMYDPNSYKTYMNRGMIYSNMGKQSMAISDYDKSEILNPLNSMILYYRGVAYLKDGLYEKSIIELTKAINMNPKHISAYESLGSAFHRKGNYHKAINTYNMAMELGGNKQNIFNNIIVAYAKDGQYKNAIETFRKAVAIYPDNSELYKNVGLVYRMTGNYLQTIAHWEKYLLLSPNASDAEQVKREIEKYKKTYN